MKQISIAALGATLIAISACSDSNDETASNNNADTSASEQDYDIKEVSTSKVDISSFEIQGLKLGMSESEVIAKLEQTCNENGRPFWTKEEEKNGDGVYYSTVFTCPRRSYTTEGYLSVTINNTVNGIKSSRKILEKEKNIAHETLVSLANKAKEKYGEPVFESINNNDSRKKFYIGKIDYEIMSIPDKRKSIIQCWADCVIKRDRRGKEVVVMNADAAGFAMTMTPSLNNGKGIEVEQYLFDFPAQLEAYKVYKEKAEAAEEARLAAKRAAEQEAAKKVEF